MSRYFFHIVASDQVVRDHEGIELPGFSAAHQHALDLLQQINMHVCAEINEDWIIEIRDDAGSAPLMIPCTWVSALRLHRI